MAFPLLLALSIPACRESGPEAPSAAENRQLDEAGEMLDDMADEPPPAENAS